MYFTGNASDNLNNKTGDYIYGSSQVFTPVVVPSGISEVSQLHGLTINPQPISNTMTISFYSQSTENGHRIEALRNIERVGRIGTRGGGKPEKVLQSLPSEV